MPDASFGPTGCLPHSAAGPSVVRRVLVQSAHWRLSALLRAPVMWCLPVLCIVLPCGCGAEQPLPGEASSLDAASTNPPPWAPALSDEEIALCRNVAWSAASSQDMRARFGVEMSSSNLEDLSQTGITCSLDAQDPGRVEVSIPSGMLLDWHPTFLGVTVACGTFDVLAMREIVKW